MAPTPLSMLYLSNRNHNRDKADGINGKDRYFGMAKKSDGKSIKGDIFRDLRGWFSAQAITMRKDVSMRRFPPFPIALLVIVGLAVSAAAATTAPALDYQIGLENLRDTRLHITLTITGFPDKELVLLGVPSYMDNPVAKPHQQTVRELRARDIKGAALDVKSVKLGDGRKAYRISPAPGTVVIDYDLSIKFKQSDQTKAYPVQIPFMDHERAWLAGNYIFCHPQLAPDTPTALHSPVSISVAFDLPPDVPLHGLPVDGIELGNLYELLSLQFGLGSFVSEELGMNEPSVRILYKSNEEFDESERRALRQWTTVIIKTLTDFFGGAPFPEQNFYYFRNDGTGGLEGAYTCQAYIRHNVRLDDPSDRGLRAFLEVTLHECFHTWNPVALFAVGDPWFKEGITCYYGNVLSLRLGHIELQDYKTKWKRYESMLESNPLLGEVALTDPRIWHKEYDGEDWRQLTYSRGQAVALLLDVMIRERSENRHSLDDVLRALYRDFARGHFTHAELLRTIASSTSIDVGPFFAEYVSGTRAATYAEVEQALEAADRLGVFSAELP